MHTDELGVNQGDPISTAELLVTDGGRTCEPTKLGYRILAILAGESRRTGALMSELHAHPVVECSEQTLGRTLNALRTCDLARHNPETREWVITSQGRALERAERIWRHDHAATRTERASENLTDASDDDGWAAGESFRRSAEAPDGGVER